MTDKIAEVSPSRAREAVQRLINSHFRNDNRARCSIPANRAEDDDLVAMDYISQSEARVAELEAENKRIAEELETSNANHRKMASEMAALGEENKRLRKCADAMADAIRHPHSWQLEYVRAKDAYRAAFPREEAKP